MLLVTCSSDTFSPLLMFYSIVFATVGDTFGKFICIRIFLRTNSAGRKQSNCSNHRHLAANESGCLASGLNLRHLVSIGKRKCSFVGFLPDKQWEATGMTSTWGWNDLLDSAAMCFHEPEAAVDGNGGMMSILDGSGLLCPNFKTNQTGKHWLIISRCITTNITHTNTYSMYCIHFTSVQSANGSMEGMLGTKELNEQPRFFELRTAWDF